MLKKNTKIIVAALGCVAILGAALAIVLSLPSEEAKINETSVGEAILLYDKTSLDVEEISVKNEYGEYQLLGYAYSESDVADSSADTSNSKEESSKNASSQSTEVNDYKADVSTPDEVEMIYTMQEYEKEELSKEMTDLLVRECNYMAATQIVDKSGKKFDEYGLNTPRATVMAVFSDGSTTTLYIGNDAPDNKGVYLRMKDNNYVYLVQSTMVGAFLLDKLQLFDSSISDSFNTDYKIKKVSLSGELYDKDIIISDDQNKINFCTYIMTSPQRENCDNGSVESFGISLYGITADRVTAVQADKDALKKYGLDSPYMIVSAEASDNTSVKVLASKADKDGNCYIMRSGSTIICQTAVSALVWYEAEKKDFLAREIINPYMDSVYGMTVKTNDVSSNYNINHKTVINDKYEETEETTASMDGRMISMRNLTNFIENVKGIARYNTEPPASVDGCELLLEVSFMFDVDGKESADTLQVYLDSKGQAIAVLNGNIEGYTPVDYAKETAAQAKPLSDNNEEIPSLESSDGSSESDPDESSDAS